MKSSEFRRLLAEGKISVEGGTIAPLGESKSVIKGGRGIRRAPGEMNKLEARYAGYLANLQHAGDVFWFGFESIKFRLAAATFYTPDFMVMRADFAIELHETKGAKGSRFHVEDDAMVKIKVAAAMFPFTFKIVWPCKQNGWNQEEF